MSLVIKNILLPVLIIAAFAECQGQSSELGIGAGMSLYWGDLNANNASSNLTNARPAVQFYAKNNINGHVNVVANLLISKLTADDSNSDAEDRILRNLNFFSPLAELTAGVDINIFNYNPTHYKADFTPFFHIGIGAFYFNPKTKYNDETIALQPLGTEGQGMPGVARNKYSRIQPVIPIGGGLKLSLGNGWAISGSATTRLTFTDYIDDVSTIYVDYTFLQKYNGDMAAYLSDRRDEFSNLPEGGFIGSNDNRGGSDVNDYYFTVMIGISKVFKGNIFSIKNGSSCPSKF